MNKDRKFQQIYTIFLNSVLILGIAIGVVVFTRKSHNRIISEAKYYIQDFGELRSQYLDKRINDSLETLKYIADIYSHSLKNSPDAKLSDIYGKTIAKSDFETVIFTDRTGTGYSDTDKKYDIHERPIFINGINGTSNFIVEEFDLFNYTELSVIFYTPVYIDSEIKGVLLGIYSQNYLLDLIDYKLFNYPAESAICNQNGDIILTTSPLFSGNMFGLIDDYKGPEAEKAKAAIAYLYNTNLGMTYEHPGVKGKSVGYCAPIRGHQYLVVYCFPSDAIHKLKIDAHRDGMLLMLIVIIVLAFYLAALLTQTIIEQKKLIKENKEAQFDTLTQLLNRKSMDKYLAAAMSNATDSGQPFSLLMLDLDDFKSINDTYGHSCGDAVLKSIAAIIKQSIRSKDYAFRWGGEEFLILISSDPTGAFLVANRIRNDVEHNIIEYNDEKIKMTVTIGVSNYNHQSTMQALIDEADSNLYSGKRNGKNQVYGKGIIL